MSTIVKVLGPGCSKCKTLFQMTNDIVTENNFDVKVEKVEDIMQIMAYRAMTPSIVINEKLVINGRVPSKDELKKQIEKVING